MLIGPDGAYTGEPGYPRGNIRRGTSSFSDPAMVNLLPPNGRPEGNKILDTDLLCKESQSKPNTDKENPNLKAAPGSFVALRYQENGHVTLPENAIGKEENRGFVYIYGTSDPKPSDTLMSIHKVWNADGSGGDKRGKLLATQNFDDGQCYQVNGDKISQERQKEFPHGPSELMGKDLWCQNNVKLPDDVESGKPYTLYWVWDWPTLPNVDAGLPDGKAEVYTTCMDIDVANDVAKSGVKSKKVSAAAAGKEGEPDLGGRAIPSLMSELGQQKPSGGASSPSTVASASASASTSMSSPPATAPAAQASSSTATAMTDQPAQPSNVSLSISVSIVTATVTVTSTDGPAPSSSPTAGVGAGAGTPGVQAKAAGSSLRKVLSEEEGSQAEAKAEAHAEAKAGNDHPVLRRRRLASAKFRFF